jgi:NIMA (never in mitosis gene a)-related kinase
MEYCVNGDMAQLIKKCKVDNDFVHEDVIWKIFMQILLALRECHYKGLPG